MSPPLLEENFFPQTTDCLQHAILALQLGSGRMSGAVWKDPFQDCFMQNPHTFVVKPGFYFFKQRRVVP